MDLAPLPVRDQLSTDGTHKARIIQQLHERVRHNIEKRTQAIAERFNQGRHRVTFEPGDWVWVHMRKERFPDSRKNKLDPRGDGPFRVAARINDNAYRLELPGEYNINATFNVADLSHFDFDAEMLDSRTNHFEEGDNDAISVEEGQTTEKEYASSAEPNEKLSREDYSGPLTRQRAKRLREGLPELILVSRAHEKSSPPLHQEKRDVLLLSVEMNE